MSPSVQHEGRACEVPRCPQGGGFSTPNLQAGGGLQGPLVSPMSRHEGRRGHLMAPDLQSGGLQHQIFKGGGWGGVQCPLISQIFKGGGLRCPQPPSGGGTSPRPPCLEVSSVPWCPQISGRGGLEPKSQGTGSPTSPNLQARKSATSLDVPKPPTEGVVWMGG